MPADAQEHQRNDQCSKAPTGYNAAISRAVCSITPPIIANALAEQAAESSETI